MNEGTVKDNIGVIERKLIMLEQFFKDVDYIARMESKDNEKQYQLLMEMGNLTEILFKDCYFSVDTLKKELKYEVGLESACQCDNGDIK